MEYLYEDYEYINETARTWDDLRDDDYRESLVEAGELSAEEDGFLKGAYGDES